MGEIEDGRGIVIENECVVGMQNQVRKVVFCSLDRYFGLCGSSGGGWSDNSGDGGGDVFWKPLFVDNKDGVFKGGYWARGR